MGSDRDIAGGVPGSGREDELTYNLLNNKLIIIFSGFSGALSMTLTGASVGLRPTNNREVLVSRR